MNVIIKNIETDEAQSYYCVVNKIKDEGNYLYYSNRFSFEETKNYVSFHNKSNNPILGAFTEDGKLIGFADFNIGSFDEIKHVAILGMGIIKQYRGKGIGKKLVEKSIESAKRLGVEKLELEVFDTNEIAKKLYKRMGFFEEGRLLRKRKCQGEKYEDIICMGLFI